MGTKAINRHRVALTKRLNGAASCAAHLLRAAIKHPSVLTEWDDVTDERLAVDTLAVLDTLTEALTGTPEGVLALRSLARAAFEAQANAREDRYAREEREQYWAEQDQLDHEADRAEALDRALAQSDHEAAERRFEAFDYVQEVLVGAA